MIYFSEEATIVVNEEESMTQEAEEGEDIEMSEEAVELIEVVVFTVAVEI